MMEEGSVIEARDIERPHFRLGELGEQKLETAGGWFDNATSDLSGGISGLPMSTLKQAQPLTLQTRSMWPGLPA